MVLYSYTNAMRTKGFTKKIDQIVEQKMLEFFGDPDSGLIIKKTFLNRLKKRMQEQKLSSHDLVLKKYGLN